MAKIKTWTHLGCGGPLVRVGLSDSHGRPVRVLRGTYQCVKCLVVLSGYNPRLANERLKEKRK